MRLVALVAVLALPAVAAASEHVGQVSFAGVAVPGATVTASQAGSEPLATTTDPDGIYRFPDLADGIWTIAVEMRGFATATLDITVAAGTPGTLWELTLLPYEEIARNLPPVPPADIAPATDESQSRGPSARAAAPAPQPAFQRAGVAPANPRSPAPAPPPSQEPSVDPTGMGAADGLLINGSVNNGAASPFAQLARFGNNVPGQRSLYTGGVGALFGSSRLDARPYSFTGVSTPKPEYNDIQFLGTVGGPLRIPGLVRNGGQFTVGYQRLLDNSTITEPARLPTALERAGDFSRTVDGFGRPVRIVDPLTGQSFADNTIPRDRIAPQAAALQAYYPSPGIDGDGYNYQAAVVTTTRTDNVQSRLQRQISQRNNFVASFSLQRTTTDSTSILGFDHTQKSRGIGTEGTFTHRFSPFFTMRARYQLSRQVNETLPHFANRINVSGEAGITGNNQDPVNWGPPALTFASGIERLADAQHSYLASTTNGLSTENFTSRGRHTFTLGGGVRRHAMDVRSQQDARGGFTFTGAATGFDFADFLLGIPATSAIAFGNADKFFRGYSFDAYITDDWRISPGLTVNVGVRWEYEAPLVERFGRLVNLDVLPGFSAVAPVIASERAGSLTGRAYADSLVSPDKRGVQPRLGLAWRPIAGSSLVVRAGYGIYRNTNVYQSLATLMAQQPPLSTSFSVQNSAEHPLTLANGFLAPVGIVPNTFGVDPAFRVGYAHNWQASMQRDLPGSMTVLATYLGTKGSHLMQQILPNTYPPGASDPCAPAPGEGSGTVRCPSGFVFLTSDGRSSRHAGQLQLRRRLRNGLTATVQYTLAKAEDDAAAFLGASLSGSAIAQNWRDLDAEMAPSNFDQRHQVTAQVQYTTGVGVTGGALMSGLKGSLFRNWTITAQLTAGSGLPFTPMYLLPAGGTGITGTVRAALTGAPVDDVPSGLYANPAAYGPPAPGSWGDAGRNSLSGPRQFSLNAGIRRTFPWGGRMNLEWGLDATNVLNRVTYRAVNALVGSPQFGLPMATNNMRKIQTVLRFRF
jgi:hypothetical protein